MTVVSNTGPLIALAKANRLDLLKQLFGQVEIPPAVHRELFASQTPEAARLDEALSRFVQIAPLSVIPPEVQTTTAQPGAGEQQAIALAFERKMLLLMDDPRGAHRGATFRFIRYRVDRNSGSSQSVRLDSKRIAALAGNPRARLLACGRVACGGGKTV